MLRITRLPVRETILLLKHIYLVIFESSSSRKGISVIKEILYQQCFLIWSKWQFFVVWRIKFSKFSEKKPGKVMFMMWINRNLKIYLLVYVCIYFINLKSPAYKIPKQLARETENLYQINTSMILFISGWREVVIMKNCPCEPSLPASRSLGSWQLPTYLSRHHHHAVWNSGMELSFSFKFVLILKCIMGIFIVPLRWID